MNERIRELAKKAGFSTELSEAMATRHNTTSAFEKFAELIVQECIQVGGPEYAYTGEWTKAKVDSVNKIKQHFGVEE